MQDYEERQQARRERYEARAEKLRSEAQALNSQASDMASAIPFGQPILVGHHSEKRDRRYRGRIHDTFGRAYANEQKADYYEAKAKSVGTGGISSDDPRALEKLRQKLADLQRMQTMMKKANVIIRNYPPHLWEGELLKLGFTETQTHVAIYPVQGLKPGFEPFALQNNNANIRRVAMRIAQLEKEAERETTETKGSGYTLREDTEQNRVMFIFEEKPDEETRKLLKSNGFKWSPTRSAWVRMLNANGRWAANCVKQKLDAMLAD